MTGTDHRNGMRFAVDIPDFGDFAAAGATWWAECMWDDLESAAPMIRRVEQAPPRP